MSHHLITRLFFFPLAALFCALLTLPAIGVLVLVDHAVIPFTAGWFFQLAALSGSGMVFKPGMERIRQFCFKLALGVIARRWQQRRLALAKVPVAFGEDSFGSWKMLASLTLVLGTHVVFVKPLAQAQMRDVERAEPLMLQASAADYALFAKFSTNPDHLATVRVLQKELHLNEYGVIRALRYLNQAHSVTEVRNLFAGTVRK